MIHVCPLSRLDETVRRSGAGHLISLTTAGMAVPRPEVIAPADHLALTMHDIAEARDGMTAPAQAHVDRLLGFARGWDRRRPVVVHCYAGISRSPAAAYILAAALAPQCCERDLAETLRRLAPSATPNARLVALADERLGRGGRMMAAIAAIGRGCDAYEGTPFRLAPAEA
ncbi:protein tyrosine phosphatase [Aquibium sp. A9E412]|uniref:tyrosine phosphatase family protein n=1 Tax=Aquibium sp. A9E412 TaxID=2976767 RepID=UPI0025B154AF|nr:protein tyrosine phosphatase [Aquibium sp. A9E412]MDN2565864.1 protein tyrosine phosphatase [Aquibium sp. A9E412]